MTVRRAVLGTAVAVLAVAGGLPVAALLLREPPSGPLTGAREWLLFANSLRLATLTTLAAVAMGVPMGLLAARTDLPGRRTLAAVLSLPLLLPPTVTAVAWLAAGSPNGPVARRLGVEAARLVHGLASGLSGSVLVLATALAPLVMLLTASALSSLPGRLEEAGLLAAPRRTVLLRITLPLAAPGILLGASLVFLMALGEATVAPAFRYPVAAMEVLTRFAAFYDVSAATTAALPLALAAAAVLVLEWAVVRWTGTARIPGGRTTVPPPRYPLGRARWTAAGAAWGLAAALVGIPAAVLLLQAGGVPAYSRALVMAGDSLSRGLAVAAAGGTLLAVEGFLLAVLGLESPARAGRTVDALALFLFALPGAVLGIGLIVLWNHPWTGFVYGTPAILLLGYLAHSCAVTLRLSRSSLELVPSGLVEAARVSGIGWGRRLAWILVPAARRGLAAAWLAGAVLCLRDVAMTLLVHPPGWDTLPVRIMTLAANGRPETIAALCVVLATVTAVPLALIVRLLSRQEATP